MNESIIRDNLAMSLDGQTEVYCRAGRIDILTDTEIIEVKEITSWKSAIGQVLAYGIDYPDHTKRIHLFAATKISSRQQREIIEAGRILNVLVTFELDLHGKECSTQRKERWRKRDAKLNARITATQGTQSISRYKLTVPEIKIVREISQKAKGLIFIA